MYTCYQMYKQMPTKLSPEIVHFNTTKGAARDIYVKVGMNKLPLIHTWINGALCINLSIFNQGICIHCVCLSSMSNL